MSPDPALQLAAAINRRQMTVRIDHSDVKVWIQEDHFLFIRMTDRGQSWAWEYDGTTRTCPVGDWEGLAETIAQFIADEPTLAATAARFRLGIEEAEVQQLASGLSLALIIDRRRKAREEFTRTTPGDAPVHAATYRARARWGEWYRIELLMKRAGLAVYDVAQDPGANPPAATPCYHPDGYPQQETGVRLPPYLA